MIIPPRLRRFSLFFLTTWNGLHTISIYCHIIKMGLLLNKNIVISTNECFVMLDLSRSVELSYSLYELDAHKFHPTKNLNLMLAKHFSFSTSATSKAM